jgi:integrase
VVATAAGAGLRWGEVAGLRADVLDLDAARLSVVRTVTEVGGHTAFKPFPKSAAGRRTVPLPSWLVPIIREHRTRRPTASDAPVFANEVGAPLRRTLFRSRIWRPSLVRAGMLGEVIASAGGFEAGWTDEAGASHTERHRTYAQAVQAVQHVARHRAGGLRFHASATPTRRSSWTTGCRRKWCSGSWGTSVRRPRSISTRAHGQQQPHPRCAR